MKRNWSSVAGRTRCVSLGQERCAHAFRSVFFEKWNAYGTIIFHREICFFFLLVVSLSDSVIVGRWVANVYTNTSVHAALFPPRTCCAREQHSGGAEQLARDFGLAGNTRALPPPLSRNGRGKHRPLAGGKKKRERTKAWEGRRRRRRRALVATVGDRCHLAAPRCPVLSYHRDSRFANVLGSPTTLTFLLFSPSLYLVLALVLAHARPLSFHTRNLPRPYNLSVYTCTPIKP